MKIAGRKTESAWFLTNKKIRTLDNIARANLADLIGLSEYADAAYNAIMSLQAECGVTGVPFPTTLQLWVDKMLLSGIPHQVWFGRLSWTTYSLVDGKYVANYQSQFLSFAKDLRKICKRFFLARRQLLDLGDAGGVGDPGLKPDGDPLT